MKRHETPTSGQITPAEPATGSGGSSRRAALSQALTVLSGGAFSVLLPAETSAALSTQGGRLVLQDRNLGRRMNELFAEIRKDKAREREFAENPVGVLGSRLSPRQFQGMPQQRLENANRVLYALLANDQFLGWLRSYVKDMEGTRTDRSKVIKDFAAATARYADPELIHGMLEEEAAGFANPGETHGHVAYSVDKIVLYTSYLLANKPGGEMVSAADMRALTDLLAEKVAAKAKELKTSGALDKQIVGVQ